MSSEINQTVEKMIFLIRGRNVMLDSDLATLYDVETKNLNRAVRRNPDLYSHAIDSDAPNADRIKRDMCAELLIFQREKRLNQRELAQKLEISEALVSKVLRYQFEQFTIDRLLGYLEKLGIKYEFKRVA